MSTKPPPQPVGISRPQRSWKAHATLLPASLLVLYALSLHGGYLNWDDPWLVSQNRFFLHPTFGGLGQIWTDFGVSVRYDLGAEYLPVRDTSLWLEAMLFKPNPMLSRVVQLSLYVAAMLRLRSFLRACTESSSAAEIAIWIFALHPAHVEVVAWLSARKDVLALLFCGSALDVYARRPKKTGQLLALTALASLSKASSIMLPLLLLVPDLLLRRRPHWRTLVASFVLAAFVGAIQMRVGEASGMLTGFAGGTRASAFVTEGTVLLRYFCVCVWPPALSLIHDLVPDLVWTWRGLLGFGVLLGWLTVALRSHQRSLLATWLLFTLPLLPTVNALFPIQNLLADRYIALSILGPCMLFADLAVWLKQPLRWGFVSAALLAAAAVTAYRARLFTSSVLVMQEAARHSAESRRASFQLAKAYEEAGQPDKAMQAYRDTLQRAAGTDEAAIRAAIALARLEETRGDRAEAARVIQSALLRWPSDQRLRRRIRH